MRKALELSGYAVVTAQDGKDALNRVSGIHSLCLVILDLVMPEMNGWDFVEQLRRRAEGPPPATVARVLRKPFPFDGLLATVRQYCAH